MKLKYSLLTFAAAAAFSMPAIAQDDLGATTSGSAGMETSEQAQQSYDTGTGTGMASPEEQTDAMNAGETSIEDMDFSSLDADADGTVTEEEFLDNNKDLADAGDIFSQIDENSDGNVTEDEFNSYAEAGTSEQEEGGMGGWFDE